MSNKPVISLEAALIGNTDQKVRIGAAWPGKHPGQYRFSFDRDVAGLVMKDGTKITIHYDKETQKGGSHFGNLTHWDEYRAAQHQAPPRNAEPSVPDFDTGSFGEDTGGGDIDDLPFNKEDERLR